ncbi:MAG: glycoside hydrolase family 88 protein [Paludibacter sp.]
MKKTIFFLSLIFVFPFYSEAQVKVSSKDKINDSNTPLHLMKPEYNTPYGVTKPEEVKAVLDRVLVLLENTTPPKVIDKVTNLEISDYSKIDKNSVLEKGTFRLTSYEWGVTYSAMLLVGQNTGDERYQKYDADRFKFLADVAPYFEKLQKEGIVEPQMRQVVHPEALDDAGAICSAMIKAQIAGVKFEGRPLIDRYIDYIMNKEYRLADGTFARNRPQHNTVWLDDMFMSLPAIANMGKLTGDTKYYDEAIKQIQLFKKRMWVPENNLFRHGWVEGMSEHPAFFWGRANGWAILTMTEVLDALPENYPGREEILELLQAHIRGLAACQSGEGFWHQLLDRNDSYLETSATAIYTYCIAHAINKGWIDPLAYGPVAMLGWNAVSTKVNAVGEVEGTCVGTGMGFDPAFYYYRPVNKYAAHGYGPVLLAGGEMIRLLQNTHPKMNDSAVQFYQEEQKTDKPIFGIK